MFPSNFVEPFQEGTTSEEEKEDVEEKEIKGKKVVGVGLGDIFGSQGVRKFFFKLFDFEIIGELHYSQLNFDLLQSIITNPRLLKKKGNCL